MNRGAEDDELDYELEINGRNSGLKYARKRALDQAYNAGIKGDDVDVIRLRPGRSSLLVLRWRNGRKV